MSCILVIEDDPAIRQGLEVTLLRASYTVLTASDGESGLDLARTEGPDLILLDLMLPGMSGYELCRRLRDEGRNVPILMLTARAEEQDRVLGLDTGADDYVVKPFSVPELMARIRALLRRADKEDGLPETIAFGNVEVDFNRYEARKAGSIVKLPPKAYGVLQFLASRAGQVVTRETLLDEVWGYEAVPIARTVDNQINHLRTQLEDDQADPQHIITVHGVGYRFEPRS